MQTLDFFETSARFFEPKVVTLGIASAGFFTTDFWNSLFFEPNSVFLEGSKNRVGHAVSNALQFASNKISKTTENESSECV